MHSKNVYINLRSTCLGTPQNDFLGMLKLSKLELFLRGAEQVLRHTKSSQIIPKLSGVFPVSQLLLFWSLAFAFNLSLQGPLQPLLLFSFLTDAILAAKQDKVFVLTIVPLILWPSTFLSALELHNKLLKTINCKKIL